MSRQPAPSAVLERLERAVQELHDVVSDVREALEQADTEEADDDR